MAEINMATNTGGAGVRRSKKRSTRVDLTPMVDLGFLLITFFIFTTSMSEPVASKLNMPADGPDSKSPQSGSLTAVLLDDNKVFYYHGKLEEAIQNKVYGTTNFYIANGFGQVIRQKKSYLDSQKPNGSKELILMIKPLEESAYRDVVDILDEVMINDVKTYALMDIDPLEKEIIKKLINEPQPK
ncbi:ExbD/TolR family protein [Pseudobacter ginsenosidimutans]|jgi:biopolymer transport protein ExbD|uniref:Biopolymer transport protein ExbD n=1 Tax=Pseudobacter ginsenosidimutans TaxID=661488 RepID=A0A4V2F0Y8_9BACT|nr:biopolymer transporter ExbD [Pseudobacter ginsenosidimutans]QEC41438.1 biopolymer transporter ExbD [Pseudobacter ginsenosidimutans]RZS71781.1 biopolymer transport protein ExbD [Pseudobacter ginsenosidimutans]